MLYNYYDYLEKIDQIRVEFDEPSIKNIMHHVNALQPYSFLGLPLVYLIDYKARSYIYYSHNCKATSGYHHKEFTEGGLSFALSLINAEDLNVYADIVFKENLQFLAGIPCADHSKYIFSTNYRLRAKNGEYVTLKQRNIFLQSSPGELPTYALGTAVNLTAIKNGSLITHQIEQDNGIGCYPQTKTLVCNYLYPESEKPVLSHREIELVKFAASGYSSKQIADKMNISLHTVKRHRSNILIKTNCKNIAELISYSLREKLL